MARPRNVNRDIAFNMYKENKAKITTEEIAIIINEKHSTIKSWKKRDKWDENLFGFTDRQGAPIGSLNGLKDGNRIDDSKLKSKKFLSKYLPKVSQNIMDGIEESSMSSLDMLWLNIQMQFTSIIRSQKIMHVKNNKDITKEIKKNKTYKDKNMETEDLEYEIQFAWDKQERFLTAQSRAIQTLSNMIKTYEELLNSNFDLATDEQKLRVDKLKAEVGLLNKDNDVNKEKNPYEGLTEEQLLKIAGEYNG